MSTFTIDSTLQAINFNGYDVQKLIFNGNLVWEKTSGDSDLDGCIRFSSNNSFSLKQYSNGRGWNGTIQYSTNKNTWTTWTGSQINAVLNGNKYKLYLRGYNNTYITNGTANNKWELTGTDIYCDGDIRNILDYNNVENTTMANKCFYCLFDSQRNLISAPDLPSTTISQYCYYAMFRYCSGLTKAPSILPATTLQSYCYSDMFRGCTSLTAVPELPATTLITYCYGYMFDGCTNLTTKPIIRATTLYANCCVYMFRNCENLTEGPDLLALTLKGNCYNYMFQGCTKLNKIKALFTTTPSNSYTSNWMSGVASSGTFYKNNSATWTTTGVNAVPSGWSIVKVTS